MQSWSSVRPPWPPYSAASTTKTACDVEWAQLLIPDLLTSAKGVDQLLTFTVITIHSPSKLVSEIHCKDDRICLSLVVFISILYQLANAASLPPGVVDRRLASFSFSALSNPSLGRPLRLYAAIRLLTACHRYSRPETTTFERPCHSFVVFLNHLIASHASGDALTTECRRCHSIIPHRPSYTTFIGFASVVNRRLNINKA